MTCTDEIGLTPEAAQGYEDFFVPAIFHQWPPRLMRAAGLKAGDNLLEVGCGTGVLAREAIKLVGANGSVTGLDLSESMLGVARQLVPGAVFHQGDVQALPFPDESFDHVIASFMLMFVADQASGVSEMLRVLKPGGRLVVSVWEPLENNPAYADLVMIAGRLIDDDAATSLAWPFILGDKEKLQSRFSEAGASQIRIDAHDGRATFASIEQFVRAEIQSWLLSEQVTDAKVDAIIEACKVQLAPYCTASGELDIPFNATFGVAEKA